MRYSVLIRLKAKDGRELKDYIGEKLYKVIFSMFKEYDNYIAKKKFEENKGLTISVFLNEKGKMFN